MQPATPGRLLPLQPAQTWLESSVFGLNVRMGLLKPKQTGGAPGVGSRRAETLQLLKDPGITATHCNHSHSPLDEV